MLRRKKALCPIKQKSERRLKLLYPLQCHKYCHSKKGPHGRVGGKAGEFALRGGQADPRPLEGLMCLLPGGVPCWAPHQPDGALTAAAANAQANGSTGPQRRNAEQGGLGQGFLPELIPDRPDSMTN